MRRLYTIGTTRLECWGHGDFNNVTTIRRMGSWDSGDYPPLFETEEAAQAYLDAIKFNSDMKVVSLPLDTPTSQRLDSTS